VSAVLAQPAAGAYNQTIMKTINEKITNPKEIEKEIAEFLNRRYGDQVKMMSPLTMVQADESEVEGLSAKKECRIDFDMKPEEMIAYLDQYVIRQDAAKQILATKVCTHFNRVRYQKNSGGEIPEITGGIKNNVLMLGPTGVGKTYIIKLIAKRIGVPFVKGDATKFSETGYVGGDVDDLVRDLVREADNDIELAQYGIVYIDEIDKIASSRGHMGPDVSRTGVQRALLKPMEETDIELKVPHDPISMIQEVEQYRKTGKRERRTVNTRNILFIMSGAFSDLDDIIKKRTSTQRIGFGGQLSAEPSKSGLLKCVKAEDLVEFGFETEFVGRLPVKSIFEKLDETDLLNILENPNNPVILSKKLDFATYGIDIRFSRDALENLAHQAALENTGARGLVSVIEQALIPFETRLPSSSIRHFPVTASVIRNPHETLEQWVSDTDEEKRLKVFDDIVAENKETLRRYLFDNRDNLAIQYGLPLSTDRIDRIADYYCANIVEVGTAVKKIKSYYDEIKKCELAFYNKNDINIVLEEDAVDHFIASMAEGIMDAGGICKKLTADFEYGLRLIQEKAGRTRYFISKAALMDADSFLDELIRNEFNKQNLAPPNSMMGKDPTDKTPLSSDAPAGIEK
jgi:ATP-dependent Clp protease ATP-binding subunit ClpX